MLRVLYSIYVVYVTLFSNRTVQGWSSLIVAVLLIGGIQLISIGMLGEYIGRISDEVKQRPLYIMEGVYERERNE